MPHVLRRSDLGFEPRSIAANHGELATSLTRAPALLQKLPHSDIFGGDDRRSPSRTKIGLASAEQGTGGGIG